MLKLNLGAGTWPIPGFINSDHKPNFEGVEAGEAFPLARESGTVDAIRASHILEHFSENDVPAVLQEWARVLRLGGTLSVAVPDFDKIKEKPEKWDHYLMGGQTAPNDFHQSVFTREKLTNLLAAAGFEQIEPWVSELEHDCASYPISLNLRGVKAVNQEKLNVRIGAIMSVPRLGFNASWGCITKALEPFKIPITQYTSAYWHQSMQDAMENAIEQGTDWILSLDYDTLVTTKQLDHMFGVFGAHPEMDALAALQPKRGGGEPLFSVKLEDGKRFTGELEIDGPIKAHSAHFGLTLFRAESFKGVQKPWLIPIPGKNGSWKEGRIDADMEFWNRWAAAGRTLYVDPDARIGHLETMVKCFDEEGNLQHMDVKEWVKANS